MGLTAHRIEHILYCKQQRNTMNIAMKTFRFLVLIDNQSPGVIVEQRAINITQATQAVQAQYGSNSRVTFYGMVPQ